MKQFILIALVGAGMLMQRCAQEEKISEPLAEEVPQVQEIGDAYAMRLLKSLKEALQTAIQEQGLVAAVKVCNLQALPLTAAAESEGIKIKRTSFKVRNPRNAPDAAEQRALQHFADRMNPDGTLPPPYVQQVREQDGVYFYYYKPLRIEALCLTCHGDPQSFPEELRRTLDTLYPQDQARGYREGDFRGVVRVKIPANKIRR